MIKLLAIIKISLHWECKLDYKMTMVENCNWTDIWRLKGDIFDKDTVAQIPQFRKEIFQFVFLFKLSTRICKTLQNIQRATKPWWVSLEKEITPKFGRTGPCLLWVKQCIKVFGHSTMGTSDMENSASSKKLETFFNVIIILSAMQGLF